jgi:hypothetical protein
MSQIKIIGKLEFTFLDKDTIRIINRDDQSQVVINRNNLRISKSYHEAEVYINGLSVFVPGNVDYYFSYWSNIINHHFFDEPLIDFNSKRLEEQMAIKHIEEESGVGELIVKIFILIFTMVIIGNILG